MKALLALVSLLVATVALAGTWTPVEEFDPPQTIHFLSWVDDQNDYAPVESMTLRFYCGDATHDSGDWVRVWPASAEGSWVDEEKTCVLDTSRDDRVYYADGYPRLHAHKSHPLFMKQDDDSLQILHGVSASNHQESFFSVTVDDLGTEIQTCQDYYLVVRFVTPEVGTQPELGVVGGDYSHRSQVQYEEGYFLAEGYCGLPPADAYPDDNDTTCP